MLLISLDYNSDYNRVKENQPDLSRATRELFNLTPEEFELKEASRQETIKEHGRIETRICRRLTVDTQWLPKNERWTGLKNVIWIQSNREIIGGETTTEARYYISSLKVNAGETLNEVKRRMAAMNPEYTHLLSHFQEI